MEYFHFAIVDGYTYHKNTTKQFKNIFDFMVDQWGEDEMTEQIKKFIGCEPRESVEQFTWQDFLDDYYGCTAYYVVTDENDNELEDLEDPTVTFQNYIETHCSEAKYIFTNQQINLIKDNAKVVEVPEFKENILGNSILYAIGDMMFSPNCGFGPKYIVSNITVISEFQMHYFPHGAFTPLQNKLSPYIYPIGIFLNNITVCLDPSMPASDNRVIITSANKTIDESRIINFDEKVVNSMVF